MTRAEELLKKAEIIQKSIDWWIKEMEKLFIKLDAIPNSIKFDHKRDIMIKKISSMIGKGDLEIRNIDNWMKEKALLNKKKS